MQALDSLAAQAYDSMEVTDRPDGSHYVRVADGAPEWVRDLVREAHGMETLPDDWRHVVIRSALREIADTEGEPMDEVAHAFADAVDCSVADLCAWLGSGSRGWYCDQAEREFGPASGGIMATIQRGQYMERLEIIQGVAQALEHQEP